MAQPIAPDYGQQFLFPPALEDWVPAGSIFKGKLPKTAYDLVNAWRALHLHELREDWNRARQQLPVLPIAPLD